MRDYLSDYSYITRGRKDNGKQLNLLRCRVSTFSGHPNNLIYLVRDSFKIRPKTFTTVPTDERWHRLTHSSYGGSSTRLNTPDQQFSKVLVIVFIWNRCFTGQRTLYISVNLYSVWWKFLNIRSGLQSMVK